MYGSRHHLNSNLLLELAVGAFRSIDRTHAPVADGLEQPVRSQLFADKGGVLGRIRTDLRLHLQERTSVARKIGQPWVNSRSLRTSHAVWLKLAGADVKDAQGQMRHSRASTTLDIYQQFVPESQQRVVEKLSTLSQRVN